MVFWGQSKEKALFPEIHLGGQCVFLRPPLMSDWQQWAQMRRRCRDYLQPFEPLWTTQILTQKSFERRLERQSCEWDAGHAHVFLIFQKSDGCLVGGMNINNICRGAAQYASLGYWIDQAKQGQGFMREAMALTIQYCFENLELHRINASTLPHNERSKSLLLKSGFSEEGFAKHYLQINGQWQDHILYGLPREFWKKN
jgi:ribosomal-protein-alanine N-acetyltransferase